jgi:hypothetical protein
MKNSLTLLNLANVLVIIIPMLLGVAFMTIIERKQLAAHQRRVGPQVTGYWGVLQPFADALKLILKENVVPTHANKILFFVAPIATLILSFLGWAIIPFGQGLSITDFNLGILYTLALSSLGVIGILFKVIYSDWLFKKENLAIKQNKDYKIITLKKFNNCQLITAVRNRNLIGYAAAKPSVHHIKAGSKINYSTNNTNYSNLNSPSDNKIPFCCSSATHRYPSEGWVRRSSSYAGTTAAATQILVPQQENLGSVAAGAAHPNLLTIEDFAHWFSGFCDAESTFYIADLENKFTFFFRIKLHLDDIKVLHYINKKLEAGTIYTYKNTATLTISKFEELQKLFNILEIKPLNTTKYLNYLAFKECCLLYYNRNKVVGCVALPQHKLTLTERSTLFNQIRALKNSMNSLRTNFILPNNHKIIITPY